jgi:uncharacterized protein (DUF58 family)
LSIGSRTTSWAAYFGWWQKVYDRLRGVETEGREPLFTPEFMAALSRLEPVLDKAGVGLGDGRRPGSYKGGQMEFRGHRDYAPGDEPRYLDWNLFARLERLYVKEFVREETGMLHILLDGSASMRLGRLGKWTCARRLAGLFALAALRTRDRISLRIYRGDGKVSSLRHVGGAGAAAGTQRIETPTPQSVCAFLESQKAAAGPVTSDLNASDAPPMNLLRPWAEAIHEFLRSRPLRGNVFLIGDFWLNPEDLDAAATHLRGAGFTPTGFHILASEETHLPTEEELRVFSLEESGSVDVGARTPQAAEIFASELSAHCRQVESIFHKRGGSYVFLPADASLETSLLPLLRRHGLLT